MIALIVAEYILPKLPEDGTPEDYEYKRTEKPIPVDIEYVGDNTVIVEFSRTDIQMLTTECFESSTGARPVDIRFKNAFIELIFEQEISELREICEDMEQFDLKIPYGLGFKGWENHELKMIELLNDYRDSFGLPALYHSAKLSQIARAKNWEVVAEGYQSNDSVAYGAVDKLLSTFGYHQDGQKHQDGGSMHILASGGYVYSPQEVFNYLTRAECTYGPLKETYSRAAGVSFVHVDGKYYTQYYISDELHEDSFFPYGMEELPGKGPADQKPPKALSIGSVVGIVVAVVVIVAAAAGGLAWYLYARKNSTTTQNEPVIETEVPGCTYEENEAVVAQSDDRVLTLHE